jgi:LacI family transcriptional regulator
MSVPLSSSEKRQNSRVKSEPASIGAVAQRAGVSIATVSRVLNGVAKKASTQTIAKVQAAALALDYRPSSAGRSLRQKSSRLVAVLAANLANPAMAAIAASAEIALREMGLVMVLCDTHDRPELQDEYLREMRAQQARAIVLLGAVTSPMLDAMRGGPIPIIFVGRQDPSSYHDPSGDSSRFVGIDNAAAGRAVAAWAFERGFQKAAILHGLLTSSATRDRVEAVSEAYRIAGFPLPPNRRVAPMGKDHLEMGFNGAKILSEQGERLDIIVCTSDLIAFGARRYWRENASQLPAPRLIGFDDSPLNDWVAPDLSSVRIPYQAFGPAIAEQIADAFGHQKKLSKILPHLIITRG